MSTTPLPPTSSFMARGILKAWVWAAADSPRAKRGGIPERFITVYRKITPVHLLDISLEKFSKSKIQPKNKEELAALLSRTENSFIGSQKEKETVIQQGTIKQSAFSILDRPLSAVQKFYGQHGFLMGPLRANWIRFKAHLAVWFIEIPLYLWSRACPGKYQLPVERLFPKSGSGTL